MSTTPWSIKPRRWPPGNPRPSQIFPKLSQSLSTSSLLSPVSRRKFTGVHPEPPIGATPESLAWSRRTALFCRSSRCVESWRGSQRWANLVDLLHRCSPESAKLRPPPSTIVIIDHIERSTVSLRIF
jgi:hypothetical protein